MVATICAYALIGVFFYIESRLRQGQEAKSLEAGPSDRGSTRYIGLAFGVTFGMLLLSPILNALQVGRLSDTVGVIGLVVMVVGLGLRYWTHKTLGAFYTRTLLVTTDHHIVDNGPYRIIRNPGYLGTLLLFIGAGLAVSNWIAVIVIAAALVSAYRYRIRSEEAMLVTEFGDAYKAYMARTWKLVPLVY